MKLIELLVKELPKRGGWPGATHALVQNSSGCIYRAGGGPPLLNAQRSDDWELAEVNREQYESALAASEGWIEWGGGECPVGKGTLVDVRYRDGRELSALPAKGIPTGGRDASRAFWRNDGNLNDIIAYRMHRGINSRANDDRLEQDLNECIGASEAQACRVDVVPPIGCACEMQDSKGAWLPVVIIAKNDEFTFGWSYDYRIVLFGDKADEFRPLRTEAEKSREKLAASLHIAAGASPIELNGIGPLYFELADAISAGKIPGVKLEVE